MPPDRHAAVIAPRDNERREARYGLHLGRLARPPTGMRVTPLPSAFMT
jgi:hypothetical protein